MHSADWQKVREIFHSALGRAPKERREFVNEACGANTALLAEVESLLSSHDNAESFMETTTPYEEAPLPFPIAYLRAKAYLSQHKAAEGAAEFQKILDHSGRWSASSLSASPSYPLAHLGLARASVLTGDTARARRAYQDFFGLWKDADPDIPILIEARQEYEKLK